MPESDNTMVEFDASLAAVVTATACLFYIMHTASYIFCTPLIIANYICMNV